MPGLDAYRIQPISYRFSDRGEGAVIARSSTTRTVLHSTSQTKKRGKKKKKSTTAMTPIEIEVDENFFASNSEEGGLGSDSDESHVAGLDDTSATRRKASARRAKPDRIEKFADEAIAHMRETIETRVGRIKAKYPPRTREEFHALLPRPNFDEDWTEEDEDRMKATIVATPQWRDLLKIKDATMGAWKLFFRFGGRLITDVIGFNTGLVFEGHKTWPDTFIRPLLIYLCLPFMRGDVMRLRLALQWAVICRDNDRRQHYLNGCTSDMFLRILAEVMHTQDGTLEPAVLRRIALRIYRAKMGEDGFIEPEWSVLMGHIELRVSRAHKGPRKRGKQPAEDVSAPDTYQVTSALVSAVIEAVEDLDVFSIVSSQTVKDLAGLARAVTDRPLKDDVAEAIKAVLLTEERQKQLQSRAAEDSSRVPA